jgi:hypothetical protein
MMALHLPGHPCDDARPMLKTRANAVILSSARMAAGMTSRARRPESRLAG